MELGVAVSEEIDPLIRRSYRGHDSKEASNSNSVDVNVQHLHFVVGESYSGNRRKAIYENLDYVHIMLDSDLERRPFPSRLEKDHRMYPMTFHLLV
jgi:hypothetical protein